MPKKSLKHEPQTEESHVVFSLAITALAVFVLIAIYSCSIHQLFLRQAYSYAQYNARSVRNQIDSKISHGIANIKLSSFVISRTTEGKKVPLDGGYSVLSSLIEKTPFTFLHYISPDGREHASGEADGAALRADGEKYFIEGIKGKSGVFARFDPNAASGAFLYFYSPVNFYSDESGVLVGGMDVEKTIKPLISSPFYAKRTIGVLCDSSFKVITANYPGVLPGSNLNDLKNCPAVDELRKYVEKGDENGFRFDYNGDEHVGCVLKLKNADWLVVQILPKEATAELNTRSDLFIFFIMLVFSVLIFLYVLHAQKVRRSTERMHVSIISALCRSYHNVYVVNLKTGRIFIYQLTERMRVNYGEKFESGSYEENFRLYENNEVLAEDRPLFEKVDTLDKIRAILKAHGEYSFVYRVQSEATGGKIHFYQCYFLLPRASDEFVVTFKNVDDLFESKEKINSLMEAQTAQLQIMSSISGIYLTLYLIDLEKNSLVEFNTTKDLKRYIFRNDHAGAQIQDSVRGLCRKDFIPAGLEFTDLSTLRARMKDKKYISIELKSIPSGWLRVSFITVAKDENGFPKKVLFASQEINSEKQREKVLISNAYTDEQTKLLNRNAYEDELRRIEEDEKEGSLNDDFVYISLDLNGLKNTNDTLGHAAGDEILRGAAKCIASAFGGYGKVFRTGGDEFQVIMFANSDELERAKKNFESDCANWSGRLCKELSVSYGVVTKKEAPGRSVSAIIKLADRRMYRAKRGYYSSKGINRRGERDAMEILSQTYTKILKVDLSHDVFSVIRLEEDEKDNVKEFEGSASKWISSFGKSDLIYESDRSEFLEKTRFAYLKAFFAKGGKSLSLYYRRKIHGKFQKARLEIIKSKEYKRNSELVYFFVKTLDNAD